MARGDDFAGLIIDGAGLTNTQVTNREANLLAFMTASKRNVPRTKGFLMDGNSHTVYWRSQVMSRIQWNLMLAGQHQWKHVNIGISGQITTTMTANFAANGQPHYDAAYTVNVCFGNEITNDLAAGSSGVVAYNNYVTYANAVRALGWEFIAIPPIMRGGQTDAVNLAYDYVVGQIEANWATFANRVVLLPPSLQKRRSDYASDALFTAAINTATSNLPYRPSDQVHLNDGSNGYYIEGDLIAAQLLTY